MNKKIYTCLVAVILLFAATTSVHAQRKSDVLTRGLVAMKAKSGNFLSWRRLGEEYYDTYYNVYRNGTRIATNLKATNLSDASGNDASSYIIRPVIRGEEKEACAAVTPWSSFTPTNGAGNQDYPIGYLDITLASVYNRDLNDVTDHYIPNDAEVADLDGDGDLEIIIKRINIVDQQGINTGTKDAQGNDIYIMYPQSSNEFVVIDAYNINWQTGAAALLWRIDCGPNMVSHMSTEINIIAYDWDEDGKAEVVLRGADNMKILGSNGKSVIQNIGDMSVNTRQVWYSSRESDGRDISSLAYTNTGAEYLIYLNGLTGVPYQVIDYPLKRLESNENDLNAAWGDGYGHRSSKYFMGAPYLDGHKPSIFLGRGIYTRHKMCALDVNSSHQLINKWTWACNNSSSPWYGNGYHNYIIADVDEDGRDEIVYGSMVIDDNGKGLSTTGFGHGDAQHVSDLDPYRKGLEFFGCLEEGPYYGFNYRNATTSQVYFKHTGTGDDGRALAANFSNSHPGASGCSAGHTQMISCVADKSSSEIPQIADYLINFRIYWDGDLLSEYMGSKGKSGDGWTIIEGIGKGRMFTTNGSIHMNGGTKNVPCFQGDILGDWREEIIVTNDHAIRVFTSGYSSEYSLPTLWQDHQYRQAMVWQMHAYNQPPHLSYYLGEMEGITMAPPPLIMNERTEISNGGSISSAHDGKQVIACENANMTINVANGASPWVFIDNAPYWCIGTDENGTTGTKVRTDGSIGATNLPPINYEYYTHTVTGGAFTGPMHLTKQGQGTLVLPNVTETYTGKTDVWAGTLEFNGTMQSSPVWLNRFATLNSTGGVFGSSISAEYAATIQPGGQYTNVSTISANELNLRFGSRVVFDLMGTNVGDNDQIFIGTLSTESKAGDSVWEDFGPEYIKPVFQFNCPYNPADGYYPIGTLEALAEGSSLNDIIIEGVDASRNPYLEIEEGVLYLVIGNLRPLDTPTIDIIDWVNYDLSKVYTSSSTTSYYLPVVGASCATTGATPTYTGTFTDEDGNVTNFGSIGGNLYSEDFEGSTVASDYWKNGNGGIFSPTYSNSSGQCIAIQSSADRGDFTLIDADYTGVNKYTLEFDAYFNNAAKTTDFAVMSKSHFPSWTYNWGYNWRDYKQEHNAYLLYLMRIENSTSFYLNESTTTITLNNSTWYHFTLNVDINTRTVNFNITQKGGSSNVASGSYTLREGESAECDGLYIRNGRYNYSPGGAGIDNIIISAAPNSVPNFTFEKPGTLTMTANAPGYQSTSATFIVEKPYVKDGSDYVPVSINDEKCKQYALLGEIDGGNSHLWRSGLNSSTWASFVLPYSMTAAQVKSVFGEGTVIGNLMEDAGDEKTLIFETESGDIRANQPFLIKGVTNASPYLIKGVSGIPVDEPKVSTNYFMFIGNYDNKEEQPFYKGDYFLTSEGLKRPKADGILMTLQGYRAFFRAIDKNSQAPAIIFDDATRIKEISNASSAPSNVYTVTGQKMRNKSNDLKGLPRGIYIVDGKTITVK